MWVGIWGVNADNFPRSCCRRSCSRLSFDFGRPWDGRERGRGEGRKDGRVGIWGVDADNFPRSCCGRSCSCLSFNFGGPWDTRERGEGEGRMVRLGSVQWMPTVAADAAVLVYLSILETPGMGGRGEREREGWVGWELGSGHCLMH